MNATIDTLRVQIERLRVRRGDLMVLQTESPLTTDQRTRLCAFLQAALPEGIRTLVIDMPAKLSVIEDGSLLFSESDAAALHQTAADEIWGSMLAFNGDPSSKTPRRMPGSFEYR